MRKHGLMLFVILAVVVMAAWPAHAARRGHGGGGEGGGGEGPQFDSGSMMLGGDFDFRLAGGGTTIDPDGGDEQDIDNFYFDLSGMFGYFVIHGLEIGPVLDVSYETNEDDAGKTTDTTWAIGAQAGYFYGVTQRLSIFGMLSVGYMSSTTEYEPDAEGAEDSTSENSGFALEPKFGAMYGINRHVGLTAALYYRYYSGSGNADEGDHDIDFDITNSEYGIRLGVMTFFN